MDRRCATAVRGNSTDNKRSLREQETSGSCQTGLAERRKQFGATTKPSIAGARGHDRVRTSGLQRHGADNEAPQKFRPEAITLLNPGAPDHSCAHAIYPLFRALPTASKSSDVERSR